MNHPFDTPWKIWNSLLLGAAYPFNRLLFGMNGISWGKGWRLHGFPIIQKHRHSTIQFGDRLALRSTVRSNPLGANHPVILCTWQAGSLIQAGDDFSMTGGSLCASKQIVVGNRVTVGANSIIVDSDFHPLQPDLRLEQPQGGLASPILIEDDVFIGMNCLILKGTVIGRGSVIGAGSVVTGEIPAGVIVAGNPARVIRENIT
jgi:acetyltransferase-like isoleucine patch superfamily enzyme